MAEHTISFTEYPHGKIRSIIADGTHWVTVSESGINASVASKQARKEMLLALKEEVEGMEVRLPWGPAGSAMVSRGSVLDAINNRLKEF
jgi:hypothetical protein